MAESYCSYEISKLLKKKGFNEPCRSYFIDNVDYIDSSYSTEELTDLNMGVWEILRPTHQMAMAWLRKKGIYITIIYGDYPANKKVFWTPQIDSLEGFDLPNSFYQDYDAYEDAVEAALKYSLENLI